MNAGTGISLKILAALSGTAMMVCIKALDGAIPTGQVVFFRSAIGLLPLLVWLGPRGGLAEVAGTRNIGGHLLRGLSGTGAMFFNVLALAYIPLADATVLGYVAPLATVILAGLLLREAVFAYRWWAVIVGFLGVVVMLLPHVGAGSIFVGGAGQGAVAMMGAGLCLLAALCSAFSSIQIRELSGSETPGAIVLHYSLMTTLIGLCTALFGWTSPTASQWLLLCGVGIFGGLAQIFVTLSLKQAHASMLAPFEYSSMLWSMIFGYVFLAQVPSPTTVVGAAIIAAAGVSAIWFEQRTHAAAIGAAEARRPGAAGRRRDPGAAAAVRRASAGRGPRNGP